jgi:hypothetical protein
MFPKAVISVDPLMVEVGFGETTGGGRLVTDEGGATLVVVSGAGQLLVVVIDGGWLVALSSSPAAWPKAARKGSRIKARRG